MRTFFGVVLFFWRRSRKTWKVQNGTADDDDDDDDERLELYVKPCKVVAGNVVVVVVDVAKPYKRQYHRHVFFHRVSGDPTSTLFFQFLKMPNLNGCISTTGPTWEGLPTKCFSVMYFIECTAPFRRCDQIGRFCLPFELLFSVIGVTILCPKLAIY